ncbi:MAG: tetratricopeptide repeat protein [Planktotalea sp.]|uniref:tetratricopeptide repeat protein n=1 Tax=Planktotalea sp. TaxID=2029877 RepID=UPI003C784DAA
MTTDRFGNALSSETSETTQAIDDFVHGFLAYQPKAANILAAAEAHPDNALINAYAGMLWMFLEAPVAAQKAAPYIANAKAAALLNPREASCVQIAATWTAGDVPKVMQLCEAHADAYPRDLVIIKLAQYLYFNIGDSPAMLDVAMKAMPAANSDPYIHGMIAFGHEQCHNLEQAEASARRAMEIEPNDAWAHHAIAHVMLTQGRVIEGTAFMEEQAPRWEGLNSFMYAHNWWHLALFYISLGQPEKVLATYDAHVWGLEKSFAQDQVGAASLLARMELAGIDVGDRWDDVAKHIEMRGADTTLPFLTMQYLYALGRADSPAAEVLMNAVREKAATPGFEQGAWQEVAMPACKGLLAHARGEYDVTVARLGPALKRLTEIGGSHAQRDLFAQVHLDALVKAGHLEQARKTMERRLKYDPKGIPLNRMLADVYDKMDEPERAKEARLRSYA